MLRHTLPPTFALTLSLFAATPASPCSIAPPSLDGAAAPADGADAVPRNARLVIEQSLPAMSVPVLLHRDLDEGADPRSVPLRRVGDLVVVDLPELEADTDYTLTFDAAEDNELGETGREPVSFRTGDLFDDEAPTLTEDPEAAVHVAYQAPMPGPVDSCGGSGIPESWTLTIPLPEAEDDVAVAGFRLLEIDERGGQIETRVVLGQPDGLTHWVREGGEKTYVVEAFDLAGNVVQSEPFVVSLYPGGGCSAATVTDDAAPVAALFLLPLLGALRRRRR